MARPALTVADVRAVRVDDELVRRAERATRRSKQTVALRAALAERGWSDADVKAVAATVRQALDALRRADGSPSEQPRENAE